MLNVSMQPSTFFQATTAIFAIGSAIIITCTAILHAILAYKIFCAAEYIIHSRGRLYMMGPLLWGFTSLIFGLIAAAFFWVAHYSKFRSHGAEGET